MADIISDILGEALLEAARAKNIQRVREFLDDDLNINIADQNGNTAAIWLAIYGYGDILLILVQKYPEILVQQSNCGGTVANCLAIHEDLETILALAKIRPEILDDPEVQELLDNANDT